MWCSKCKLSSIHVKNFDRIICTRGHLLCTGCFEGNLCPICGSKIKQKIKMFVDGTPKIYFIPIDSDNDSDYQQGYSEFQDNTSQEAQTTSDVPEFSDSETVENHSSILQFSSDFESEVRNFRRDQRDSEKPQVIDLHPPVKNFMSEDEDDRSSTKLPPNPPSLKGSHSSVCIGSSRSISRFKTKSEENIKVTQPVISNIPVESQTEDVPQKPQIIQDPKELFLKTFYSGKNEDDSFDARSHYYKTMAELNAFRDFIVQSSMSQGDGNRRPPPPKLDETSSENINRNPNLKPHSQKIVDHLKEFRRETRYKPPKKFKVYKNYSETSGNMIITSSNSSQSTIHNVDSIETNTKKSSLISPVEKMEVVMEPPELIPVLNVEKEIKKQVMNQIVDQRAIEIREKLKAEIYSNFENNSTVTTNNDSFIENATAGDSMIVNPTMSSLKSLLRPDTSSKIDSPGSRRSSSSHTQKSVLIQPHVQIMHPFSFFSTSCEQKRLKELERVKAELREKLKSEVYSIFDDHNPNLENEEENLNCFIEENDNYSVINNPLDGTLTDSFAKLTSNLNRLKLGQQISSNQSELNLELQNEESDVETERTTVFTDQTLRESTQYDFLYDSALPSTGASTACRACVFHGSTDFYKFGPPLKLIPIQTNLNRPENLPSTYPKAISEINIDRSPVKCPITSCEQFIFISSFSKHIKIDHQKILIESITPGRWRNMFLDPRVDRIGVNKCQMFYLISDKITGLGNSKYKDYLPVMVMSTRVDAQQLFDSNPRISSSNSNFLMIWLTGLCVSEVPVYYSLTVWSDYQNPNRPKKLKHPTTCHLVHSKKLYSIRHDQDHMTLYKSGSALIISEEQCKLLSDYGRNMIELQIFVH